jgi:very-short-patch-repair endonuclease
MFLQEKVIAEGFAAKLRKKMTFAERRFKKKLKQTGIRFKTQKIIYRKKSFYIIDFYIPGKMLCIELDGGYHLEPEQITKDEERDKFLIASRYQVWRMTNSEGISLTTEEIAAKINSYPSAAGKIIITPEGDATGNSKKRWKRLKKTKHIWRAKTKKKAKIIKPGLSTPAAVLEKN